MKKIIFLITAMVIAAVFMAGCSDGAVIADFENYLNVEMVQVNKIYAEITAEIEKSSGFETDEELALSIKEVLVPKCDRILEILSQINPSTDRVKAVKQKFVKIIELYKEAFIITEETIGNIDQEKLNQAGAKLQEVRVLLSEYNKELEELAKLSGTTIG